MSCEGSNCICDVIHNGGSHSGLPFPPLSRPVELHLSVIRPQVRIRQSIYPLSGRDAGPHVLPHLAIKLHSMAAVWQYHASYQTIVTEHALGRLVFPFSFLVCATNRVSTGEWFQVLLLRPGSGPHGGGPPRRPSHGTGKKGKR